MLIFWFGLSFVTKIYLLQLNIVLSSLAAFVVQTTHSISLKNTALPAASTAAAPMLGLASISKVAGEAVAEV